MNRIQLLILNQQIYDYLVSNDSSFDRYYANQDKLLTLTLNSLKEIDTHSNEDKELVTLDEKFNSFEKIDEKFYNYLDQNIDSILAGLEQNLLAASTMKRLPLLFKSLYVTYVTVLSFDEDRKKVYMNEILEISKMYLEEKFCKMLNKVIDSSEN